jgi:hypothetical protein
MIRSFRLLCILLCPFSLSFWAMDGEGGLRRFCSTLHMLAHVRNSTVEQGCNKAQFSPPSLSGLHLLLTIITLRTSRDCPRSSNLPGLSSFLELLRTVLIHLNFPGMSSFLELLGTVLVPQTSPGYSHSANFSGLSSFFNFLTYSCYENLTWQHSGERKHAF